MMDLYSQVSRGRVSSRKSLETMQVVMPRCVSPLVQVTRNKLVFPADACLPCVGHFRFGVHEYVLEQLQLL